jgi:hypothetical protein
MADEDLDWTGLLRQAAAGGDVETVQCLLSAGVSPETGAGFDNALIRAIGNGHVECARALIAGGADPNTSDWRERSALWHAVDQDSGSLVKALLDAGADPNAGRDYANVLRNAVAGKRGGHVSLLLEAGADPNTPLAGGFGSYPDETLLGMAAEAGSLGSCSAWSRPVPIRAPMPARPWSTPPTRVMIPVCPIS